MDKSNNAYSTPAQIAGHVLASIFLDTLAVYIERMQQINRTLAAIPRSQREEIPVCSVAALTISPSERLDNLAARWRAICHSSAITRRR